MAKTIPLMEKGGRPVTQVSRVDIGIRVVDGILYCSFPPDTEMDLAIAKDCVRQRLLFSKGKSYACLIDMRGIKSVTKEARHYMAEEGAQLITAGALIVGSPLTRMLGNIFLAVHKPKVPTKLFDKERDAIEWLRPFVQ